MYKNVECIIFIGSFDELCMSHNERVAWNVITLHQNPVREFKDGSAALYMFSK